MSSAGLIHELVAKCVERQPDACALDDPRTGERLTYHDLWERAGWLAADLAERGVGPRDLVGVGQDRSVEFVVTLLGILRTGAAYLPLDGMAPASRLGGLLAEAGAALVVCAATPDASTRAPWRDLPESVSLVPVPRSAPAGAPPPPVTVDTEAPAYVCHTSGSTGRPKGVVVPHRAVLRLVREPNFCSIGPGDRVSSLANPAFDVTTFEVWNTLTAGGTLVVVPALTEVTIDEWVAMLVRERLHTVSMTTSLFHTVARERPDAFGSVRTLAVAGEQLDMAATRRVLAAGPPERLVNAYGPTEATCYASFYDCTEESLAGLDRVPIGHPIQRTSLHLRDDELRPVAPGESGELCIGGPGVATGYLGRPELTAERFVTDPRTGETLYRTGDMGRELPSGAIELLGRRDRQVKLRGFRVELAEIERCAVATGLVDSAFVEKVGEGDTAALVGFALPAAGAAPTTGEELNRRLAERLPGYMLPPTWVLLDEVPVNSTGKADRGRLLALLDTAATPTPPSDADADAGPTTEELRRISCEVLDLPDVRPEDNFIDQGGDSMLATQVVTRIRERLDVETEPAAVLLSDSLADLAGQVREMGALAR